MRYREKRPKGAKPLWLPNDFVPRPYQVPVFNAITENGAKRAVCVWPRRHGKDLTWLHIHSVMSQKRVGAYWHCLPSYAQAKKTVWNAFRKDGKPMISNAFPDAMLAGKPNDSEMMLRFRNGSTFQLVGADNIDTLVGAGPVGISFSEYALAKPGSWDLIRPILRENDGWAGFMSTPRGRNHFCKLFQIGKKEGWFTQFETIETAKALPLSIIDEERAEGMPEELIRQEFFCDWTAALIGSVFGDLLEKLERDGGICEFEHPFKGVYTSYDLGVGDSTAVWFWQLNDRGVQFIDHYESHGKPISHYFDVVDSKPYEYTRHYVPHDSKARTLVTGTSVLEEFLAKYGADKVGVVPSLSLADGIQAGRKLLQEKGTRFHVRCEDKPLSNDTRPLEALRHYHYPWLEDEKVLAKKPAHDWSSHTADCLRYVGVVKKLSFMLDVEPPKPKRVSEIPSMNNQFQLEVLYEQRERDLRNRRI